MHPKLMFGDGCNIEVGIEFCYMLGDINQPLSCWNVLSPMG
jgi:hypothetical protein